MERLKTSGEADALLHRHVDWFIDLGLRAGAALNQTLRLEEVCRLRAEHPNLRAALTRLDETDRATDLLRLSAAMGVFWYVAWHYREGLAWLERALARAPLAPAAVRADAANGAGRLAIALGDFAGAAAHLEDASRLAREASATGLEVWATLMLGGMAADRGDYAAAEERLVAAGRVLATDPAHPGGLTEAVFIAYHRGIVAFGRGAWGHAPRLSG